MAGVFDDLLSSFKTGDKGTVFTPTELKELQFGFPLRHFCQQYLFGATGLRIGVFNSISGIPQSCKSPLLFDLMGHVAASRDNGGLGGLCILYEMESKISPSLLNSILSSYGEDAVNHTLIVKAPTINSALNHFTGTLVKNSQKKKNYGIPVLVGMDSIGGSGSNDTADKMMKDGAVGKGFYDKAHFLKYFCENAGAVIGDLPIVILCINQEKEKVAASPFAPQPKEMMKITGGVSQIYKDGFMVHTGFDKLRAGNGKLVKLRTMKTSFSDDRSIEVVFKWNAVGTDVNDAYNHRFEWAECTADVLAHHEPMGTLRDVCDVRVSDEGLVTCSTLGLKSVKADEFEEALMSDEYKDIREQLYTYLKIDKLKSIDDYAAHMAGKPAEDKPKDEAKKPVKKVARPKKQESTTLSIDDPSLDMPEQEGLSDE